LLSAPPLAASLAALALASRLGLSAAIAVISSTGHVAFSFSLLCLATVLVRCAATVFGVVATRNG